MSSPAVTPDLDYVDHPSLGRLSFPKDMPPDERNASIVRMMAQQKTGLSPALRQLSPAGQKFFAESGPQKTLWEKLGIVPSADVATQPLKPGEQAGPSGDGSPGELLMQGLQQGASMAGKAYAQKGPGEIGHGVMDVSEGNVKEGLNRVFSGAGVTMLPLAPEAVVSNPAAALRAVLGGYAAGKAAKFGTQMVGGDEQSQQLAENIGNLGGGAAGAAGSPKAVLNKVAGIADMISPEVTGIVSPRLANAQRLLLRMRSAVNASGVQSTPEQITPENLLEQLRKGAADKHGNTPTAEDVIDQATRRAPSSPDDTGINDATQTYIRPRKQGIEDMLAAAKAGEPTASRVDAHKVAKTAIGEQVSSTPDAVIYGDKGMNTPAQEYFIQKMRSGLEAPTVTGEAEQNQLQQMMNAYAKSGTYKPQSFFKQYPAPEMPPGASPSEVRAASSPNPPRSSLAKNQKQLANFKNSPSDVAQFQEQASQELFGKSFNDLPVNDPASRLKATMRAIELQVQARSRK